MVTTNTLDGYKVVEYISPVTSSVVMGTNYFTDVVASISDIVGGRSNKYQNEMVKMYDISMDELKKAAINKGANCILGIKVDFGEISGKGMQMFMLNAIGTAVKIIPEREYLDNQELYEKKRVEFKEQQEKEKERQKIEQRERAEKSELIKNNFDDYIGKEYKTNGLAEIKPDQDKFRRSIDIVESGTFVKVLEIGSIINVDENTFWVNIENKSNMRQGWVTSEKIIFE
jgi:uncharacterized protein YbjQ (UPF0145 family)